MEFRVTNMLYVDSYYRDLLIVKYIYGCHKCSARENAMMLWQNRPSWGRFFFLREITDKRTLI